ncbi:RNA 3'-terminal phosphate cyclase [Massilia cavernae]|uniref:RNA 3'-terminal phosphate cyclase n=1 Tax=Massilia cavernae TaxID=2320864 RepID=A0A418XTV3_9BURK|nr:RNA 3'-terminal phosphate cyclase [Massilia cavernae]RJG16113.1 RNA 3'-terminal phosphate cyclase [Massilia cavernae]
MIDLDGSQGEGGGQILRTSLTLSMITGTPFRVKNIRANRAKPGLMRQHLVAVQAAAEVCGADVSHADVGSQSLEFRPGPIRGGDYRFDIGTAGSSTLVLQTLLPALLYGDKPSAVTVIGGTHNPMAPPVQFLKRAYGRVLAQMGATVEIHLKRFGFYPAGGGEVLAEVTPCPQLRVIEIMERGPQRERYAEAVLSNLPPSIGQRELDIVGARLGWPDDHLRLIHLTEQHGPGNALMITVEYEHVTEVFSAIGDKRVRAEAVADAVVNELKDYLDSTGALGEHLADQVMLPMALAGGGRFTLHRVSQHALTNADVIGRFVPVKIGFEQSDGRCVCIVEKSSL